VHDPPVWTLPPAQVARIAAALADAEVVDARTGEARRRELPLADILMATRLTAAEFRSAERLRWIQTSAVGVGGLLCPEVVESDVLITNARGVHADTIAEHAIALVLALRRGLHVAAARQAAGDWAQVELASRRVAPLGRSRLLVVGLGEIGGRVARLGAGLGLNVTGVRRDLSAPTPDGVSRVVAAERLPDELPAADAVVLAVPRTDETRALIGAAELAMMRSSAVLVNVARGALVDEAALAEALAAGRLAGAGIDAFPREPLAADSPWWRVPNLIVTPHTAAFDGDYWTPVVDLFLDNVDRFRRGAPLRNLVDKRRGY
jgi:phosphoglycerate dehydrogenase-like enzyme